MPFKSAVVYVFFTILCICFLHPVAIAKPTQDESSTKGPICHFFLNSSVVSIEGNYSFGDTIYANNNTVQCNNPTDNCFNIWNSESSSENGTTHNKIRMLYSGCFRQAKQCKSDKCTGTLHNSQSETRFCCCEGDYCNRFDNIQMLQETRAPNTSKEPVDATALGLIIVAACVAVAMLAVIVCVVKYTKYHRYRKHANRPAENSSPLPTPSIDLDHINFGQLIGTGRYGRVYTATLKGESVAVKVLQFNQKQLFTDETYIYSLPLMEHPNLLTYFGAGEVMAPDTGPAYGIVLSLCNGDKLSSFLSFKTLNFSDFCQVVVTLTKGLAHLHAILIKGDLVKPCVAHRDFNTRNILVRSDLSCVICDMGFAIHTRGARFYVNGEERVAEMASLTDVGTIRYMAPEVLEGAVNLRDCETSLKQIDVYALGLVLWEVACRCHDLYQGTQTPPHQLPFQKEIGLQPSFEQMQVLVARNKARPLFPWIFKDTNSAIHQLKETIEDCWDTDADARLSASCVEKRLSELETFWVRHKASLCGQTLHPSPNSSVINRTAGERNHSHVINNQLSPHDSGSFRNSVDNCISESTMETIIPNSPSDNVPISDKNESANNGPCELLPALQPHQGRNPCFDRNYVTESVNDHVRSGNTWLDQSQHKPHSLDISDFQNSPLIEVLEKQNDVNSQMLTSEHLVPLLNGYRLEAQNHNSSLPVVQPQSPLPPIPYLQNQVTKTDPGPKMVNAQRQKIHSKNKWKNAKTNWGLRLSSIF